MTDAAASSAPPAAVEGAAGSGTSYGQILKSTAMIGASSLVNVAFSILRMKAIAVLLGPGGVGLMSLYTSMADLAQTLAGLGIQASGVRQIAEAAGTGEQGRIARTATALKRVSLALGLGGALLLAVLALPLSTLTFGDGSHAGAIVLLSAVVFFGLVSAGQLALLQGLRRIADLARISMLSAMFSAAIAVPLVFVFSEAGIVPALVLAAAASLATSWWFSARIGIAAPPMSAREIGREAGGLLNLGLVFMASGFLTVGAAYAIRLIVLRAEGIEAAGFYQAAWALGGLYAGFILQAMGTDFYPRLTAAAADDALTNRLVNEQTHIGILLAGPGLLATLTVAPLLMTVFYSPAFGPAADLLRWLCLGMMLRVVAWPMGFIVLARGAALIFFWTEVAATAVHVGLAWLLVPRIGPAGAGVAFVGLYLWHTVLIHLVARRLSGFRWTRANLVLGGVFLPTAGLVFCAFHLLPAWMAAGIGIGVTLASGLYCLKLLLELIPALAPWRDRLTRKGSTPAIPDRDSSARSR